MSELFTDTVLNMMTATADPEDYTGEDGLLYCGKCRTAKEAYFLKKPLHGWGMTNTRQNVTANGKSVWSVKLPRNAGDTLIPLWN